MSTNSYNKWSAKKVVEFLHFSQKNESLPTKVGYTASFHSPLYVLLSHTYMYT